MGFLFPPNHGIESGPDTNEESVIWKRFVRFNGASTCPQIYSTAGQFTFLLRNHARTYTPLPASVIGHVADMTAES